MNNRKPTRLQARNYLGHGLYYFTICCAQRRPYLANPTLANAVLRILFHSALTRSFSIHAYCLMPDHVHILAEGTNTTSNALEFIRNFKQQSAFLFKQKTRQLLWEFSYYDFILRSTDSLVEVARYIWWNPVRKNLCHSPADHPFSGSQTIPWMQASQTPPTWLAPWQSNVPTAKCSGGPLGPCF